jgi:RimJ/RimL family protein N-acetyltransferase
MNIIPATIDHFEEYYHIRSEISNLYWLGYTSPPDREKFYELFKSRLTLENRKILLIEVNETLVGSLTADIREADVYIGYSIKESFRGKGYGHQALGLLLTEIQQHQLFPNLKIQGIKAWISQSNLYSHHTALKSGFVKTTVSEYRMWHGKKEQYFIYAYENPNKFKGE